MQNILVTGASVFLGRNLMMKLSKNKKFTIYGLIHSSKNNEKILGSNFMENNKK